MSDPAAATPSLELAFLRFEVADLELWGRYLAEVIGVHVDSHELPEGPGLCVRVDDRAGRLYLHEGGRDDLVQVGWDLGGAEQLQAAEARLHAAGVEGIEQVDRQGAWPLHCEGMLRFRDPAGIPVALVHGQHLSTEPLDLLDGHQGFVAGDLGLGHVVLKTRDKARSMAFYEAVLGLRRSDRIVTEVAGYPVDLDFFHAPSQPGRGARHHSLAVGGPLPKRLHHFMLECRSMDDVGACYDRMVRLNLPIFQTLGRHPNDRMLSFYAITPSGFQVEVGWGGRLVCDETWQVGHYEQISEWGHHHPTRFRPRRPRLAGWPEAPERAP